MPSTASRTQLDRLNTLLAQTWKQNAFYRNKWHQAGVTEHPLDSLADLQSYPLTSRAELIADQAAHPPVGTNLSCALERFTRYIYSSGTTGNPILWADTNSSWEWVAKCSAESHALTGVEPQDVLLFIGPLASTSGPWVVLEGARRLGCTCLIAGSDDFSEAYRWLGSMHPNVLVGKPEFLQLFAMMIRSRGLSPALAGIERIIMTGPGSSIDSPARHELQACWDAPCFDRYGMTEAGSVAAECVAHTGALHILDEEFIAEVIHCSTLESLEEGAVGELVLTNLGRTDRPIIRYRTGDRTWMLRDHRCSCRSRRTLLPRGILGRLR